VKEDVDGAVWASLITPDGGSLPAAMRQVPAAVPPGDG
jgi:hypothetical protein